MMRSSAAGTAGFTAALSIVEMERNGLTPAKGPVIVTGATGGVGSFGNMVLPEGLGDHPLDIRRLGNVGGDGHRLPAQLTNFPGDRLELWLCPGRQGHVRAGPGIGQGDFPADPPARSGAKHPAPPPGVRISIAVVAEAG